MRGDVDGEGSSDPGGEGGGAAASANPDRRRNDPFTPLGTSDAIARVLELARRVAPTDAPVLITGESGTGKEMVAQFIHRASPRAEHLLIPVHCAALPPDIVEAEIFGEEGVPGRRAMAGGTSSDTVSGGRSSALSGGSSSGGGSAEGAAPDLGLSDSEATGDPGLLSRARGGTLLLDDVDHLPPLVQLRLLRVIERRGAAYAAGPFPAHGPDRGVNLRFMSTLTRPAHDAIALGRLRTDLFYRLSIFPIHIPPLRERREDIPLLARHFLSHYWRLNRREGGATPVLSREALEALRARPWAGNVRELQHVMERAAVALDAGQQVRPADLPQSDAPTPVRDDVVHPGAGMPAPSAAVFDHPYAEAKARVTADFERNYLTRLIRRVGGNMHAAAKLGGVNKTTLYRLLQKYDLTREEVLKD